MMKNKIVAIILAVTTVIILMGMMSITANAMPISLLEEDDYPQPVTEAVYISSIQKAIMEAAISEPCTASGYCAQWVMNAYKKADISIAGNACDLWAQYCDVDVENIKPGMLIAVQRSGPYGDSYTYGHVGIYIGDNKVVHSIGKKDVCTLEEWIKRFDWAGTVRCGFPDEVEDQIHDDYLDYCRGMQEAYAKYCHEKLMDRWQAARRAAREKMKERLGYENLIA